MKGRIFRHDNAPAHRGAASFLEAKGVEVLEWPAYSPDLNPIENLWGHMKMSIRVDVFTDVDDLVEAILTFWEELDQAYVDALVLSFKDRLQKVVDNVGDCIALRSKHPLHKV